VDLKKTAEQPETNSSRDLEGPTSGVIKPESAGLVTPRATLGRDGLPYNVRPPRWLSWFRFAPVTI